MEAIIVKIIVTMKIGNDSQSEHVEKRKKTVEALKASVNVKICKNRMIIRTLEVVIIAMIVLIIMT